jgi:LysM repeat protein
MPYLQCPYLGLHDDRSTVADFPSVVNCCHYASPITAVDLEHQQQYCFMVLHRECPVLLGSPGQPLPRQLRAETGSLSLSWKTVKTIAAVLSLLVVIIGLMWFMQIFRSSGWLQVIADNRSEKLVWTPLATFTPFVLLEDDQEYVFQRTIRSTATKLPAGGRAVVSNLTPSLGSCAPPEGWIPVSLAAGQSLEAFVSTYGITLESLLQANCLASGVVASGALIYLPPLPTLTQTATFTPTATPCIPPTGWVIYYAQANDTLAEISRRYGISVLELQMANCLETPALLYAGRKLYVPPRLQPTLFIEPTWTRAPLIFPTATRIPPTQPPPTQPPPTEPPRPPTEAPTETAPPPPPPTEPPPPPPEESTPTSPP